VRYERGDRVGATARLRTGAIAAVFDGDRLLLTRRADNGEWCLPGGGVDPGETPAEACVREVREETGLEVEVVSLLGVYSDPHLVVAYADGNRWQPVSMVFRAELIGGEPGGSDEVIAVGFFTAAEAARLDVIPLHCRRLDAIFAPGPEPFFD